MEYNQTFLSLSEEAAFTSEILKSGVTKLGKANYAQRGLYFEAFTNISLGIERLGKLCVLLDYYIHNNMTFPNEDYIRKIGHDLSELYNKSHELIKRNNIQLRFDLPNTTIHKDIMKILTNFAKGDRYANLNALVNSKHQTDPILEWSQKVDDTLFDLRVSKKKKEDIKLFSEFIENAIGSMVMVRHFGEDRQSIDSVESGSYRTGKWEATAKYRQLYTAHIIRYWADLLSILADRARELNSKEWDIPYLNEFFVIFRCPDSYLLTRKTYT